MKSKKRWLSITIGLVLPLALLLSLFPTGIPLLTNLEKAHAASSYQPMVSAGLHHTVGLKSDGTVVATGYNSHGQCDVSSWSDIYQVSAGLWHTAGLKSDDTVVATGRTRSGECDVSGWSNIQQISAGYYHTVGLKSDGTAVATGYNYSGQCDVSGWSDIHQVSAGGDHTVGLKSDGTVVATGDNDDGQCNVSAWSNIEQASAGRYHTVGLESDGTVVAAGPEVVLASWNLGFSSWFYYDNHDGILSKQEILAAVFDFFVGHITGQQVLEVIVLFFS